jgi:hypothetical protein
MWKQNRSMDHHSDFLRDFQVSVSSLSLFAVRLTTLGTGGRRAAQAVLSWKLCRGWPLRPRREGERRGTGVMESAAASESSSVEATVTLDPAELAEREAGATEMEEEVSARPTASSRCVATQQPLPSPKP